MAMRLALLVALVCGACTASSAASAAPPTSARGPALVALLERGPCYGACPSYKVEAFDDGSLIFSGGRFVSQPGVFKASLSLAQLAELKALFQKYAFASIKSSERVQTTDLQWLTVSDGTKTVRHSTGDEAAPPNLVTLEAELDRVLNTAQWLQPADR
jgi:hypothetical protein